MKKIILTLLAATTVAGPMLAAPAIAAPVLGQGQERHERIVRQQPGRTVIVDRKVVRNDRQVSRQQYKRWAKGQRFDRRYAQNYRVVDYRQYRGRGLYAPPRGYQWARSGNDAVLVGITSGLIGAVIGNAIR